MPCKTSWQCVFVKPGVQWRPFHRSKTQERHASTSILCSSLLNNVKEPTFWEEVHQQGRAEESLQGILDNAISIPSLGVTGISGCWNEGILSHPSIEYIIYVLHDCRKKGNHGLALRLYAYMHKNGMAAHKLLGNYLVLVLNEVGETHLAEHIFDSLLNRSQQSWSSLITTYVNADNPRKALVLYEQVQQENDRVSPHGHTCVALIRASAKLKDVIQGLSLHAVVVRAGLLKTDAFIGSALVDMYAKCGLLRVAQEVFDHLPVRDVVSWNSLITGYTNLGRGEEALACLDLMKSHGFSPTNVTFLSSLKACSSAQAAETGQQLHTMIEKVGLLETNVGLCNTLMDMYAKCGLLSEAQEVFNRLQARDVVSWNAVITGYTEHGHDEEALECLDLMQQDGVFPDSVTCVCGFKACGNLRAMDKGQEIHAEVERKGFLKMDSVVGNALIDMYGKCGLPILAHQVLDKLCLKDTVAWNALITGYAMHDYNEEAVKCFEEMQLEDGVFPDAATFISTLKALGSMGTIDKVFDIHAEVERKDLLEVHPLVGSTLVDAYAKGGSLLKAQEVFDRIPFRGVVSWTALISGYTDNGHADRALKVLENMRQDGFLPDVVTYVCILKACGHTKDKDKGHEIHTEIEKIGLLKRDIMVASTLVDMYANCGMLEEAQDVFHRLPAQNVAAWNALIAGYAEHGQGEAAIMIYNRMSSEGVVGSSVTYISILQACEGLGVIDKGEEIHCELSRIGLLRHDLAVGNALIDMYAKFGLVAKAQEVFDGLPSRDVVSWNSLLSGYAEGGHGEEAYTCLEQMQLDDVPSNLITLVCILKACGSMAALDKGCEIHAEIERTGLVGKESSLGTSLVDMYAKCGSVAKAQEVFDKLPARDIVSWTALIAGYAESGYGEDALHCFEEMQLDGHHPDAFTFVWSLKACGGLGATDKGQDIHAEIERKGLLEKDVVVGNSLLDMYIKCTLLGKAQQAFDKLPIRDLVSWNSLLVGYTQSGESESAFRVFDRMLGEGLKPGPVTFTILLNACSREGLFNKGHSYFEVMSKDYGVFPTLEHGTCMVDLLCRRGQLHQAVSMMKKLSLCTDLAVWHSLLTSSTNWGNLELGRKAFEYAVNLDEQHATSYVFMSKLFMDKERAMTFAEQV